MSSLEHFILAHPMLLGRQFYLHLDLLFTLALGGVYLIFAILSWRNRGVSLAGNLIGSSCCMFVLDCGIMALDKWLHPTLNDLSYPWLEGSLLGLAIVLLPYGLIIEGREKRKSSLKANYPPRGE